MKEDLRYALRSLRKSPRFALAAIAVLALGIGANTAMFSVVYHVLLSPLPFPDSGRLVFIEESSLRNGSTSPTARATFQDWRAQSRSFESIAAAEVWGASLTGGEKPEEVDGLHVSTSLLKVLRAQPLIGRGFDAGDEGERVVLLSYTLWQRRFAGDAAVLGRTITLNGERYQVIGVMPRSFRFPPFWAVKTELWAPLEFASNRMADRNGRSLRVFARLTDRATIESAASEMSGIAQRLAQAYPESNQDRGARVTALAEVTVGRVRQALGVLAGAVAFLLLIVCANVANLLLARAGGRRREIALRLALGAGRGRLIRQLLFESVLLSAAGAACGIVLASWALSALAANIGEASRFALPRFQEIGMGTVVLAFTAGISCATAILFGMIPALRASRLDLHAALKESGRSASESARTPLRRLLVAGEVAISLVLVAGAGLMLRSLTQLGRVDAGFDPRNVLTMRLVLTGSPQAATPERRNAFYKEALERVRAVPGVESASGINHLPLAGDLWTFSFAMEGRPAPPPSERPHATFRTVFPGYFRTMRIPILRGRDIDERDTGAAPHVVVINQTMAAMYWPGEDALGKRIRLGSSASNPWYTVAGIVKDSGQSDWGGTPSPEFYFPQEQNPEDIQRYLTLVARTARNPLGVAAAVEEAVWSLDRDLPLASVLSMEQVVARAQWQPRFSATLLAGFAAMALLLAAVGIYGVMAFDVSRRTREIGVRMALGARPADVLRDVLLSGARLTLAGIAVGTAGAFALTRYLGSLLYQVSATDPAIFAAAALVLLAAALAAVWLPARRATRIDPAIALRGE